ncbi:MAG: type II CRISPR-associated endonuclease Cas1 [Opitutales bacterium]
MSYHVLHIFEQGVKLSKDRAFLVCKKDFKEFGRIAIEDLRAVVLLSEAVSLSASLIATLCDNDTIILHCKNFKPVGITASLSRTYDALVVLNQSKQIKSLSDFLWAKLLRAKVENNIAVLKYIGAKYERLEGIFSNKRRALNEAWAAREYWSEYFPSMGEYGQIRERDADSSPTNLMLNYGYGVLGALVHRAIIIAGLNPLLGVNHKTYYKNTPLVYDLIEPYRACVDLLLYKYVGENGFSNIRAWAKFVGIHLREFRLRKGQGSVKLMDCIDFSARSLANAYRKRSASELWIPNLNDNLEMTLVKQRK